MVLWTVHHAQAAPLTLHDKRASDPVGTEAAAILDRISVQMKALLRGWEEFWGPVGCLVVYRETGYSDHGEDMDARVGQQERNDPVHEAAATF